MKAKLLKTKSSFVKGQLEVTHVYINKSIAKHEKNKSLSLNHGYEEFDISKCQDPCPPADGGGYYMCVGGNCVYFPYP